MLPIIVILLALFPAISSAPAQLVNGRTYTGRYTASQPNSTFSYLDGRSGTLTLTFYSTFNGPQLNSIFLQFLDPAFIDQKVVNLQIKQIVSFSSNQWNDPNHKISVAALWKENIVDEYQLRGVSSFVQIWGYESEEYETVGVFVYMKGVDFEISAQLGYIDEFWSNLSTSLLLANVAAIQLICSLKLIKVLAGPALIFPFRMSLYTLIFCTILDFANIVTIGSRGLSQPLHAFYTFSRLFYLLPLLLSIFLYAIVDFRMMALVWRSHNLDIANHLELPQARRRLIRFYAIFVVTLAGYVVSMFYWGNFWWHIVGSQLALMGQVVRNVRKNCQEGFNLYYIFGYVGVRIVVPIYLRGCPVNQFNLAPDMSVVGTVVGLFLVQVGLLYFQSKFGSRFFVPKRFRPNYFDYRCRLRYSEQTKDYECTVCLQNLFEIVQSQNMSGYELEQGLNEPLVRDRVTVAKTPCSHYFHRQCLTQWMDVKMECPTCRRVLPPF